MNIQDYKSLLAQYDIYSHSRMAAFWSQCHYESQGFTHFIENLNYSATALLGTFPNHFDEATARNYAHQSERIANHVYANRNGNGDESSGDGWLYRGRGLIQVTFLDNYTAFAKHKGMTIEEVAAFMETETGAVESACWWWMTNGCNHLADEGDIKTLTKRINGGYNGLIQRESLYQKYLKEVL